ncbi:hypothetical protein MGSAQ_000167 [marine sediment metagenome]|uniref:Uncharacterized protein n=1 Tax=marine sediment metagenome TaxID=412755 RepID=A0A1B6NZ42_9ZZZZ
MISRFQQISNQVRYSVLMMWRHYARINLQRMQAH